MSIFDFSMFPESVFFMNTVERGGVEFLRHTQKRESRKAGVMEMVEAVSGAISDIILSSE